MRQRRIHVPVFFSRHHVHAMGPDQKERTDVQKAALGFYFLGAQTNLWRDRMPEMGK